ncbi:MAG: recombinase family protein [Kofleriaceae bacterium]
MALVAQRLNARGFTAKSGKPFDKNAVHRLLRNPLYVGKVKHDDALYLGEHEAIIPSEVFERVQRTMDLRGTGHRAKKRPNRSDSLLTGLLRCLPCDGAMSTNHATNRKGQRYRYYRCRGDVQGTASAPRGSSTRTTSRPPSRRR